MKINGRSYPAKVSLGGHVNKEDYEHIEPIQSFPSVPLNGRNVRLSDDSRIQWGSLWLLLNLGGWLGINHWTSTKIYSGELKPDKLTKLHRALLGMFLRL